MERERFSPLLTESRYQHAAREHGGHQLCTSSHSAPKMGCNAPTRGGGDDGAFTATFPARNNLHLIPGRAVHWEAAMCGVASFFV